MSTEFVFCLIVAFAQKPTAADKSATPQKPAPTQSAASARNPNPAHKPPPPRNPATHAGKGTAHFYARLQLPLFASSCDPFFPGFFFDDLSCGYFFSDTVSTAEFIGPPCDFVPFGFVPYGPFGFGGIAPSYVLVDSVFYGPAVVPAFPPMPAQVFDPRVPPRFVQPAPPPGGTTDIPERLVDDLIGKRRPSLAQRAQAARLEGGGDRLFQAGHFARAAERYQQALAQTPDDDEAKFKRGAALAAAGQFGEAGRVLRDALRDRPDWPFVPHDLRTLFSDEDALSQVLDRLQRESRRPDAASDLLFLHAYFLYFSGQREAAEAIFRNPPHGGSTGHFTIFQEAIERQRGNR